MVALMLLFLLLSCASAYPSTLQFFHSCLGKGKKRNLTFQMHSKCIWLYTCPTLTLSLEWYSLVRFAFIYVYKRFSYEFFFLCTYLQRKEKEETNEKYKSNRNDIKGLNDQIFILSGISSPSHT